MTQDIDDLPYAFDDLHRIADEIRDIIVEIKDEGNGKGENANADKAESLHYYANELMQPADDLEAWMTTYESAVNEKLKDNRLILERETYQTLVNILQWNKADVRVLAKYISELMALTARLGDEVPYVSLDVKQIPTVEIPADIARYPVFVLDRQGYCLCGTGLDTIKYIDEVREELAAK